LIHKSVSPARRPVSDRCCLTRTRHAMRDALLPRSDGEQGIGGGAACRSPAFIATHRTGGERAHSHIKFGIGN
jgi:hypothetical protein